MIRVELYDGTPLEFPPETKQEVIDSVVKRETQTRKREEARAAQLEADKKLYDPTSGMSGFDKAAAGVGKAIVDTGRGLGQLVGLVSKDDIKESRARDAALMNTGAGLAGNIAGNVGMALLPGGLVKGAGAAAGMMGAGTTAHGLNLASRALLAPQSITQGLAGGAALGMIQPAENSTERLVNVGMGAVGNAAIPAIARGWQSTKAAAEPFYQSGKEQIVGRAIRQAAGPKADEAISSMAAARELVPGSLPTAGQSANNAGIAALERSAAAVNPSVTTEYGERMATQAAARIATLSDMAGTSGARDFFRADLQSTANDLYKNAFDKGMDLRRNPLTGKFKTKAQIAGDKAEITKLLQTPAIQEAVEKAKVLAANEMQNISDPTGSVLGLHYVKTALDDMISKTEKNEQRILIKLKDRLLTTIDKLSPDYKAARSVFSDMARPVNQMDTAQEILNRALPPGGTMTHRSLARALNDKTAQSAQKFKGATLEKTFDPEQRAILESLLEDLRRAEFAKNAGRGAGSDTAQKLAYANLMDTAGVPTLLRNWGPTAAIGGLAGRGMDAAYARANRELGEMLAEAMLDPKKAAALAKAARTPGERQSLLRYASPALAGYAPGLLYGQQQ